MTEIERAQFCAESGEIERAREYIGVGAGGHAAAAPSAPSPFARDLADALADPVVRILLVALIREAIADDRRDEIARSLAEAEALRARANERQAPQRGTDRTSWVGRRFAAEQARQAQEQEGRQ